jgi:Fe-S-cluster containining protein
LCDHCTGKCCRYFSLPIDEPTTWDDYDTIRWYLAHGRTMVYVEKGQWFLLVMTRCQYLTADDRCRIYLNRPKICQDYTTANCEYEDEWSFDKLFETPEQIWEYAEAVLPPRRRRRGSQGPVLPIVTTRPITPRPGEGGDRRTERGSADGAASYKTIGGAFCRSRLRPATPGVAISRAWTC